MEIKKYTVKERDITLYMAEHSDRPLVILNNNLRLDVTRELNPGGHFREPDLRTAKGIMAIL